MINLMPDGGLCNRLRVIENGLRLARMQHERLNVFWFLYDASMNSTFSELFEPLPTEVRLYEFQKRPLLSRFICTRHNPLFYDGDRAQNYLSLCRRGVTKWLPLLHKDGSEFIKDLGPRDYSWLKPCPRLLAKIEAVASELGSGSVGLHIRRTDNEQSICNSPLELFIQRIEREIAANGNVKFFLATDDEQTKQILCLRYPENIVTRQNVAARNDREGVADAVIDLFVLSRTRRLYGSYWSSFSEVASWIGGIPLEVVRK